ncbi:MAG: hydrogenase nickel incorporation protein HypB [Desulfobacterales bacterium]|nr:MAG: hydrogenase nickel incorporation protein HypB [Desulfobacterales bacterium]UCD90819.1 MAG: hydrogenase nickel incorporation protein HypB [Desulfobacterales bacterium]
MNKTQRHLHHKEFQETFHYHEKNRAVGESKTPDTREIKIVRKVLDVNDTIAKENRNLFAEKGVFVLNVMSSPGSGKTSILEKLLSRIVKKVRSAVIVGDICTSNDADRLSRFGAPAVQINTDAFGGDCHLAAHVIKSALGNFNLDDVDLLIVENLGNLVCPAEFDMGEDLRVVVLSVTEGEDKPIKYPLMFRVCDVALLNKIDLLPHLDYSIKKAIENILQVNPSMAIFEISAKTEDGFDSWIDWLEQRVKGKFK